jgi:formylmethanofuran dehydrogenase subunit E
MLQEVYGVVADKFEMCDECGEIYDSESEGIHVKDGTNLCGACKPEADKITYCDQCGEHFYVGRRGKYGGKYDGDVPGTGYCNECLKENPELLKEVNA